MGGNQSPRTPRDNHGNRSNMTPVNRINAETVDSQGNYLDPSTPQNNQNNRISTNSEKMLRYIQNKKAAQKNNNPQQISNKKAGILIDSAALVEEYNVESLKMRIAGSPGGRTSVPWDPTKHNAAINGEEDGGDDDQGYDTSDDAHLYEVDLNTMKNQLGGEVELGGLNESQKFTANYFQDMMVSPSARVSMKSPNWNPDSSRQLSPVAKNNNIANSPNIVPNSTHTVQEPESQKVLEEDHENLEIMLKKSLSDLAMPLPGIKESKVLGTNMAGDRWSPDASPAASGNLNGNLDENINNAQYRHQTSLIRNSSHYGQRWSTNNLEIQTERSPSNKNQSQNFRGQTSPGRSSADEVSSDRGFLTRCQINRG